jgi:aldehyde dehydrogenase family 7 protein A1
VENYKIAIKQIKEQGGEILYGGKVLDQEGNFVQPTITRIDPSAKVMQQEVFVPV